MPSIKKIMDNRTEAIKYKAPHPKSPRCNKCMQSLVKLENVVNPPRKPIIIKLFHKECVAKELNAPSVVPIKKHPNTLTVRMPTGNVVSTVFDNKCVMKKRRHEPSPPPRKIRSVLCTINQLPFASGG